MLPYELIKRHFGDIGTQTKSKEAILGQKTKGTGNSNGIPPWKSNGGGKIDSKLKIELTQPANSFP